MTQPVLMLNIVEAAQAWNDARKAAFKAVGIAQREEAIGKYMDAGEMLAEAVEKGR